MATRPWKPVFISTAPSFEEELREALAGRCKLVYGLGFLIGLTVFVFYAAIVPLRPAVATPLAPYALWVYGLHAVSVGLAAAVLFVRQFKLRQLLVIDFILLTLNILLAHFVAAVFDVSEVPTFAIALLLIVHAAFLPVPVGSQLGLATIGALGYPVVMALVYSSTPAIQEYWSGRGGVADFRLLLLEGTFQLAILGAASVVITKALYHLRESLHEAKRLGNYVIEGEIGKGGMGQVFLGQHALIRRPTAVKVIETDPGDSSETLARFEREVHLSAGLTHPNTITIYDFGRTGANEFYYAMEYLDGLDLQQLVERFGPLPPERAVHILTQVCGSLAEAHASNIIHRDIKPSNIFLTHRGGIYDFVKVLDFGLAKEIRADDATEITQTGVLFGTPLYLAPETARDAETTDERSDLYALGAVAYWMLAARPPFTGQSAIDVIVHHVKTVPTPPSAVSEVPIPTDLEEIVMKCLEKDPDDRFQTALELQTALGSVGCAQSWSNEEARAWWRLHHPEQVGSG